MLNRERVETHEIQSMYCSTSIQAHCVPNFRNQLAPPARTILVIYFVEHSKMIPRQRVSCGLK